VHQAFSLWKMDTDSPLWRIGFTKKPKANEGWAILQMHWLRLGENELTWNQLPGDQVLLRPKKMPEPLPAPATTQALPPPLAHWASATPSIQPGLMLPQDEKIKVFIKQDAWEVDPLD
jgi:hypothetical protein